MRLPKAALERGKKASARITRAVTKEAPRVVLTAYKDMQVGRAIRLERER